MATAVHREPHISIVRDGPFYRVRANPVDALPPCVRQPETHGSHLSANMAARILSDASGLPVVDRSSNGGG